MKKPTIHDLNNSRFAQAFTLSDDALYNSPNGFIKMEGVAVFNRIFSKAQEMSHEYRLSKGGGTSSAAKGVADGVLDDFFSQESTNQF